MIMNINSFIDILLLVHDYLKYQNQFSQSKYCGWNFPKVTTKPSAKPFSGHETKFYSHRNKRSFSYQWFGQLGNDLIIIISFILGGCLQEGGCAPISPFSSSNLMTAMQASYYPTCQLLQKLFPTVWCIWS